MDNSKEAGAATSEAFQQVGRKVDATFNDFLLTTEASLRFECDFNEPDLRRILQALRRSFQLGLKTGREELRKQIHDAIESL